MGMKCIVMHLAISLAELPSVESCFTVNASEPEPKLDCGNAAGQEPKVKACRFAAGWSTS